MNTVSLMRNRDSILSFVWVWEFLEYKEEGLVLKEDQL